MGMNMSGPAASSEPEVLMDINTTPLIDVMLVLLVMLIITIPIQLHAVNLDLPNGTPPAQQTEPKVMKIDIDAQGRISMNGEAMPDLLAVNDRLAEIARLDLGSQPEVHLRPDKHARYETVAAVMACVQRLGLTRFGIVGAEQFIE